MAQFSVRGFSELEEQLRRLGNMESVAQKMLSEAAPVLEQEVKAQAEPHKVTGDMAESIKKTKPKRDRSGGYILTVRPTGKDRNGIRNMEKLAWLEYGVKGRAATPILTTAVLNAAPEVLMKMQEVFQREVQG